MLLLLAFVIALVAILALTWKRALALVVVAMARRKKLQLTMDAFTVTSASGVKLKLPKGPVEEVRVRDVALGWGPGPRASGIFNFSLARGPRVRVTLTGVQVKLAAAAPAAPEPSEPAEVAPSAETGTADAGNDSQAVKTQEESSSASIFLLALFVIELREVAVVDEDLRVLASLEEGHVSASTAVQGATAAGLRLLLPRPGAPGEELFALDKVSLQHEGALSALRHRGAPLQRVSLTLGTATVALPSDFPDRAEALLAGIKRSVSRGKTKKRASAAPPKPRRHSLDGWKHGSSGSISAPLRQLPPALNALPRDINVEIARISVSGVSEEGLKAVFAVDGAAATARVPDSLDAAEAALSGTASWQKLACSLAPEPTASPALDLQCSSAEAGLTVTAAAAVAGGVGPLQAAAVPDARVNVDARVKINAMHTRVKHWDLQDLAERLPSLLGALAALRKKAKASAAAGASGAADVGNGGASTAGDNAAEKGGKSGGAAGAAAVGAWRLAASLGEGSSLQFLDGESECMWMSSLQSADLTVDRAAATTTAATAAASPAAVAFQATEITMITAQVGPTTSAAQGKGPPLEKVLAARLVRLEWAPKGGPDGTDAGSLTTDAVHAVLHPASAGAFADVSRAFASMLPSKKGKKRGVPLPPPSGAPSRPRRLPSLSFTMNDTLLVAPTTVHVPAEHSSISRAQSVACTLGAALSSAQGVVHLGAGTADLSLSDFGVTYSESTAAQRFPEDVAAFRGLAKATVVSLRACSLAQDAASPAVAAVAAGMIPGDECFPAWTGEEPRRRLCVEGLAAVADADAIGCAIQAADDILAMYALLKASARPPSSWSRRLSSASQGRSAEDSSAAASDREGDPLAGLGTSGTELDATDVLTLAEEREGGGGGGGDGCGDGEKEDEEALAGLGRRRPPLCIDIAAFKVSLPLNADLEVSVEVDAAHAELAASRGVHLLHTQAAVLSTKGKPVIKCAELAASLHTSPTGSGGNGGPIPLAPLHPMQRARPGHRLTFTRHSSMAASLSRGSSFMMTDWSIQTSPGGSPTAAGSMSASAAFAAATAATDRSSGSNAADNLPSGLLPYHRARLGPWLHTHRSGSASGSAAAAAASSGSEKEDNGGEGDSAYLGAGPRSVADAHVAGLEICVPYDREPGPTQRYAEMYFKALSTAFTHSVKVLRKKSRGALDALGSAGPSAQRKRRRGGGAAISLFPMQVNLRADGFKFRFEHHPMEHWLAAHGPALRRTAVQAHLWTEASAAVAQPEEGAAAGTDGAAGSDADAGSPHGSAGASPRPASGSPGSAEAAPAAEGNTTQGKGGAWEALMADIAAQYKEEVAKIAAQLAAACATAAAATDATGDAKTPATGASGVTAPSPGGIHFQHRLSAGGPCRDLLLVGADAIQVLAVVCGSSGVAEDASLAFISRVDPPSAEVELSGARRLHLDVVAHTVAVRLAGAPQPFVAADRIVLSGAAAVAKQRTAPAATASRTLAVGAHRAVSIAVNLRGCKAPFKLYTDLEADARRLLVVHGPGYEPALALMGMAGKRLAPSDPDKTAPRPPPVPWWDDMRYLWRGRLQIHAAPFRVILAAHQLPVVDPTSPRMVVRAAAADLAIGAAGDHLAEFKDLSCTLYQAAGVESTGGALLAMPFIHAPVASARLRLGWRLPRGRAPEKHHLFPAAVPEDTPQTPIAVADVFKAEGLDVALEVSFGEGAVGADGAPLSVAALAPDGRPAPLGTALGFLGDRQIAFLREFGRNLRATPPYIRACVKRGTYFARKPRGGPPKKGLPKLLQLFRLSISAAPLEIAHYTVDPGDPSAGLRLGATSASFGAAWLCNQPKPSFLQLPPHVRGGGAKRTASGAAASAAAAETHTITQDFSLALGAITMHRDDPADDDVGGDSPSAAKLAAMAGSLPGSPFAGDSSKLAAAAAAAAAADHTAGPSGRSSAGLEDLMGDEADLEEGSRHAAALLRSLIDQRDLERSVARDRSLLSAASLSVSRRPKRGGGGDDDGDGGGGGDDPGADPIAAALGQRQSRPLRVVVSNCRFLMDLSTRDAVWGAVAHLVAAFGSRPQPAGRPGARNGAGGVRSAPTPASRALSPMGSFLGPSSSMQRREAAAEVQRRLSSAQEGGGGGGSTGLTPALTSSGFRSPSSSSEAPPAEANELLSLLLQQREAAGGDTGSALTTPHATADDEILAEAEGDGDAGGDGDALMTTPLDDVHSVLRYEVEVSNFQVIMLTATEAGPGPGRLLLAAKAGRLRGLAMPDGPTPLQITTLGLEAVQAYVAVTDVDPHVSLTWLDVGPSGFIAPPDVGPAPLRRVFNPIAIDLRHSKVPSSALTTRRPPMSRALSLRSPTPGGGLGAAMIKAEELVLKIPEIAAVMDGKEFEVVADVVTLLLTPGPNIETVASEAKLLAEGESEEVEDARALFALVRQQLAELRQETLDVARCLGLSLQRSGAGGGGSGGGGGGLVGHRHRPSAELHAFVASAPAVEAVQPARGSRDGGDTAADLLPVLSALREHLAGEALAAATAGEDPTSQPSSPRTPQRRRPSAAAAAAARRDRLTLLLRWVQEQESAAAGTYNRAKETLLALKAAAGKQAVSRSASRVLVSLDRIVWQLCSPERTPFVQASLRGLTFDRHRNRDHSGSAKFMIHRLEIIDATGALPEGPATPPGVILTNWNPDASYERDPVLRVVTTMGVPTKTHTVFEHLDTTLHPLSLHLTETIAVACWEYFFPKEDARSRQEAFSQSVGSAAGGRGRRSSVAAMEPESPMASAGGSGVPGGSPLARRSMQHSAEYPDTPPRGSGAFPRSTESTDLLGALDGGPSGASTPSSARAAARGAFQNRPGGVAPSASGSLAVGAGAGGGGGGSKKDRSGASQVSTGSRSLKRFVYVKLNRAHMRITYQGYPIGIKDRILVINSYSCENLDGRWRDLLANVKQKAILSAVWSGLGLQGRKIKELMDGAAPAVPGGPPPGDDARGAKGLLAKMGIGPKGRSGAGAAAGAPEMSEEELRALHKKRALFGNQMVRNLATRTTAAVSAAVGAVGASGSGSAAGSAAGTPGGSAAPSPRASPGQSPTKQGPPPAAVSKGPSPLGTPREVSSPRQAAPVPTLDLAQPLPPEDPSEATGSESMGPLGASVPIPTSAPMAAASTAPPAPPLSLSPLREGLSTGPLGAGLAASAAPESARRLLSTSPRRGPDSARSHDSGGGEDPVAALLGTAFQQQQQQAAGRSSEEQAAAQLLGVSSPQRGAGNKPKWMAKVAAGAKGAAKALGERLKEDR